MPHFKKSKWSGLQARMAISYMCMTIAAALILEILVLGMHALATQAGQEPLQTVAHIAQYDAQEVSATTNGNLSTSPIFILGDPDAEQSIVAANQGTPLATIRSSNTTPVTIVLLITPDGKIVSSSYPDKYAIMGHISQLLPNSLSLITNALTGLTVSNVTSNANGRIAQAVAPVQNRQHKIVGVIYTQATLPDLKTLVLSQITVPLLISCILLLILAAPVGGLFGIMTTRGLVHRLQHLVTATTLFADGHYMQRVHVTRADEISQLERQFNLMAEQLVASIAQQQDLASQNACLAERARISRELHDAISQDLFSLKLLAGGLQTALALDTNFQTQITMVKQTTTRVLREMRALLLELRPVQLEQLGLAEALEMCAQAYSTRLGITVTTHIIPVPLNTITEDALLRIAQEALSNAVRHADASVITVSLMPLDDSVELVITDNGKGFTLEGKDVPYGLGLSLMQERVQKLKGTFNLYTAPGHGVRIQVNLSREKKA